MSSTQQRTKKGKEKETQQLNQQEQAISKSKAIIDFTSDLLIKLHSDYLLVNRICYKVKHQYRRQRQFHYITQFKKGLRCLFQLDDKVMNLKPIDRLLKELFIDGGIESDKVKEIQQIILNIGALILEMLKLKLYPSYSIIILGIMSRANAIFDYFNKNKDKIADAIIN